MSDIKDLRFECTRCGNCCIDKNTIVNVTYLDISRIKAGLNLNLDEVLEVLGFYVFEEKPTDNDLKRMVSSPIETEKGLAFVGLIKNKLGHCYFFDYENKKCLIYELRPMFCRTFPFSFKQLKNKEREEIGDIDISYTEKGKEYCPGIGSGAPVIKKDYWIKLGKRTIEELNKNSILIIKWNNSVQNGHLIPSAKNFIREILKSNEISIFNS